MDLNEALALNTSVYNTGIRVSMRWSVFGDGIAEINYFTGVSRPGDDVLEWTRKADGLLDQSKPWGTTAMRASVQRLKWKSFCLS